MTADRSQGGVIKVQDAWLGCDEVEVNRASPPIDPPARLRRKTGSCRHSAPALRHRCESLPALLFNRLPCFGVHYSRSSDTESNDG